MELVGKADQQFIFSVPLLPCLTEGSTCLSIPPSSSLSSALQGPTGLYRRSLSWQVGCLSVLQSSLMLRSPRSFCCRSSSVRLRLSLSMEARSWQQPDVRPQSTSLWERFARAHRHCSQGPLLCVTEVWFPFLVLVALWGSFVMKMKTKMCLGCSNLRDFNFLLQLRRH